MSFAICRIQKLKGASAITGVQIHNRRERLHSNTNPDIDFDKKAENYSLFGLSSKSYNALADERIRKGYTGIKAIRKDAVKVCEALFTSDTAFFIGKSPEQQRQFFLNCLEWIKKRYGEKNIISAIVHLDETTPHMHVDFVPLTADGRLSAKSVLGGKMDLQRLQDDFYETIGKPWGLERGERADLTSSEAPKPRKHDDTPDLKRKTIYELDRVINQKKKKISDLNEENEKLSAEAAQKRAERTELEKEVRSLSENRTALKGKFEGLQDEYQKRHKETIEKLEAVFSKTKAERAEKERNLAKEADKYEKANITVRELQNPDNIRKTLTGDIKMPQAHYNALIGRAVQGISNEVQNERLKNEVKELESSYFGKRYIALNAAYERVSSELADLKRERREFIAIIAEREELIEKTEKYLTEKKLIPECKAYIQQLEAEEQRQRSAHSHGMCR